MLSSPEPFHYATLIDPKNIPFRGPSQQDASDLRIFIEISSKFSISEYCAGECQQESASKRVGRDSGLDDNSDRRLFVKGARFLKR